MRQNITVGVDGTPAARAATRWAAREAARTGDALRLVHAVKPLPGRTTVSTPTDPGPRPRVVESRAAADAEDTVRTGWPDLEVVVVEAAAGPVQALLGRADETDALVVGVHRRRSAMPSPTTSVGDAVVRAAPCPVVLVPEDDAETPPSAGAQTVPETGDVVLELDPTDVSAQSAAIGYAFRAAAVRRVPLRLVDAAAFPARRRAHSRPADPGALAESVEHWRTAHPELDVVFVPVAEHQAADSGRTACLLVTTAAEDGAGRDVREAGREFAGARPVPVAVCPRAAY